jgi:hypothetical protein
MAHTSPPSAHEIDVLEETTSTNEERLSHLLESKEVLERRHAELIELRYVLRETAKFFEIVLPSRMALIERHKDGRGRLEGVRRRLMRRYSRTRWRRDELMNRKNNIDRH